MLQYCWYEVLYIFWYSWFNGLNQCPWCKCSSANDYWNLKLKHINHRQLYLIFKSSKVGANFEFMINISKSNLEVLLFFYPYTVICWVLFYP